MGKKVSSLTLFRATRLRFIWCDLSYDKRQDIKSSIFGNEEMFHYSKHFILHVLDDPLGSKRMDPYLFAM